MTHASPGYREDEALIELRTRMFKASMGGFSGNMTPARTMFALSGVVAVLFYFAARLAVPGLPGWSLIVFIVVIGFAWMYVAKQLLRREHKGVIAATLLGEGRCATCAYPIATLPDEGPLAACPECGSRWSRNRLGTPGGQPSAARLTWWRELTLPPIITDARRRAVRLTLIDRRTLHDRLGPDRGEEARHAVMRVLSSRRLVQCGVVLVWMAFCIFPLIRWVSLASRGIGVYINGIFAVSMIWFWLYSAMGVWRIWTGRGTANANRIATALLHADVCPACAADLRGREPGPAEERECPACRAVWKSEVAA